MTKAEIIDYLYDINVKADISIEDIANQLSEAETDFWIVKKTGHEMEVNYTCPNCQFSITASDSSINDIYYFCPQCGKRMCIKESDNYHKLFSNKDKSV